MKRLYEVRNVLSVSVMMLLATVMAACSADQDSETAGCRNELRLSASSSALVMPTRASDGLYASTFSGGEQVRVWLRGSGDAVGALFSVGAPQDGKSPLTAVAASLSYPAEDVTVYAVYPSGSDTRHVVRRDQRNTAAAAAGDAAYKASDLMYARVTVAQGAQAATQHLLFEHRLVKLKVVLTKDAGVGQVRSVTLNNVLRRVPVTVAATGITVGTAVAAQSGDADYSSTAATNNSILLGGEEAASDAEQTYTYCCVLPAQSWTDAAFLTVVTDTETIVYKTTKALAAGNEYTVALTVEPLVTDTNLQWAGPLATR